MMFREIRSSERITDTFEEPKDYLKIKPEHEMTTAEVDNFWFEEFKKIRDETANKGQE